MTSDLFVTNSYLALSALAPAVATPSVDRPERAVRGSAPIHYVAPAPFVALTPSSVRLKAERTDGRVSLTLV